MPATNCLKTVVLSVIVSMGLFAGIAIFNPASRVTAQEIPVSLRPEPTDELRLAVDQFYGWLDQSPHGPGWRYFLKTHLLDHQLPRGGDASLEAVAEVLDRFESNQPGLEIPRFAAVRTALRNWYHHLQGTPPGALVATAQIQQTVRFWSAIFHLFHALLAVANL